MSLRLLSIVCLALTSCAPSVAPTSKERPSHSNADGAAPLGALAPLEPTTAIPVEADDARLGNDDAAVTIVAFLDFQCAFCAQGFATLQELRKGYKDEEVRIVFKHLPLHFHEMALPAAIAGQSVTQEAGSAAFFEYAALAFESQSHLNYTALADLAERAGLARDRYNELVGQEETVQRVIQDARLAQQIGVDSTPAFFINGRLVAGAQPIEYFRQIIGEELAYMKEHAPFKSAYQKRVTENMRGSVLEAILAVDPEDYRVPVDGSATWGKPDAAVTMVVFTDFECPYCKRAETTLDLLRKKYGEKLRIVFKHAPLPFHEAARPAALLTEAIRSARGDAAFFAASADLFKKSPELSRETLETVGKKYGLEAVQLRGALSEENEGLNDRLLRDSDLADDVLARGTPHFFINGKRLVGARPIEQFEALIDHGLRRAAELQEKGIPANEIYATLQEKALTPGIPETIDASISAEGRPTRGGPERPVTIHVFSDFECPYCRQGESIIDELDELFPKKLRIVWHDFPLSFHERARPAARAAREAFTQGGNEAFWKMHALLFNASGEEAAVTEKAILAHGRKLGLDEKRLEKAISSDLHDEAIDADITLGESIGIQGTPAYVVGDYLVTGVKTLRFLERLVEKSLEPARDGSSTATIPQAKP